jgi:alginate O-acetyltransferase complex protein AlgJ
MRKESKASIKIDANRPGILLWLPGVFLFLVLLLGVVLSLLYPTTFPSLRHSKLMNGEWTACYQKNYEDGLILHEPALTIWTAIRYVLFAEGQEGVLIGEDGWLYTTEEFREMDQTGYAMEAALEYIRDVHDALSARGIMLVVALVPTKAGIYSEHLGRYELPSSVRGRYGIARQGIFSLGIDTPDLMTPLLQAKRKSEVFLKTDTHWTAYGAQIAAEALAGFVRPKLNAIGSLRGNYMIEHRGQREWRGDLLNFIPLGLLQGPLGLPADTIKEVVTIDASESTLGLFDELQIPVVLVGTSYSTGEAWNFDDALKVALQADVLNIAIEGQGPFVPMKRYLEGPTLDDPRPDVIIWEIPERYLGIEPPFGTEVMSY